VENDQAQLTRNPPVAVVLIDVLDLQNRDDCEHVGLGGIATYLRERSIKVDLISILTGEPADRLTEPDSLDCVYGFSIYPNTALDVIRYADAIKARNPRSLICVGGQLASAAAAEILEDVPSIDFCVLGDGEYPMFSVVRAVAVGQPIDGIPSIFTRNGQARESHLQPADLGALPWPARDFLPLSFKRGNRTARINSSLGCAASCTFCSVNGYYNAELAARPKSKPQQIAVQPQALSTLSAAPRKRWRARSVVDVFNEITWLNQNLNVRSFVFNDASFEDPGRLGKMRIRELCTLVQNSGLKCAFRCSFRAESFKEEEEDGPLLDLMRSTGFAHIFVGIEAGSADDLRVFDKMATVQDNERIIGVLKLHDIDLTMGFIMLNPYSTRTTTLDNYRFLVRHGAFVLNHYVGKVHVYFGTALHRQLQRDGHLSSDFFYRNPYAYSFANPEIQELDDFLEELRNTPVIARQTGRMYSLSYKISELRALFGADAAEAAAEFKLLQERSAAILASYFQTVFDRADLSEARKGLDAFKTAMEAECKRLESYSLRLVYNPTFRNYLLGDGWRQRFPIRDSATRGDVVGAA
jgi:anaerobic magnesium-protoporphyrin IX monomethyl ester cyclase